MGLHWAGDGAVLVAQTILVLRTMQARAHRVPMDWGAGSIDRKLARLGTCRQSWMMSCKMTFTR